MNVGTDATMEALRLSLHGLAARQRAIADNVANVETPGFKARRVDFEASLRSAMAAGDPGSGTVSEVRSGDAGSPNGNNVNIETETLDLTETNLRYQLSVEAVNEKFRLVRSIIRGIA